ncbi:hypothetical protein HYE66_06315 [Aggregatibacter actinomycetemcomitans]|nr:hypothetical protein [Aggregatibacter actinomycetemcomitans]
MKIYSYKELRNSFKEEHFASLMDKIKKSNPNLGNNYLEKYCFMIIDDNKKLQIKPKIKIIPSSENDPFNGDREIKKHISTVTSNMEALIQLKGIISSIDYIINNIEDSNIPHEFTFAGCISIFFSLFKESKGFNKLDQSFIQSDNSLKDIFEFLEKLRDEFYCHKQSAIGYNILGMYVEDNKIVAHTKEETKTFFIYSDMKEFLSKFRLLVDKTMTYIEESRLKESKKQLEKILNHKKYKDKLMEIIEKEGKDEITHSKLIYEILNKIKLRDRIAIKGNNI